MPMLDVFKTDVYGVVSLTTSINKLPYVPGRLGSMGLFGAKGVTTTTVVVEEKRGLLTILPTAARGTMPTVMPSKTRKAKSFIVPHIPINDALLADDVQNVRAFGSESETETIAQLTSDKLADMRQAVEVTHEWHRIGAVKGVVYDADGSSIIYDWFQEFDITPATYEYDFTAYDAEAMTNPDIKQKNAQIIRHMQDSLGMTQMSGVRALCGQDMWDSLITCPEVAKAFDRYQDSAHARDAQVRTEFTYAGITYEEYRGSVGNTKFIADDEMRLFPEGVNGLFTVNYAPADFLETVNTIGKPVYVKQEAMKWDKGIEFHAQSNPLFMCTRPAVLVTVTEASS